MRLFLLSLALGALLALAACGGKTTRPGHGDPAGPPGDTGSGGDSVAGDDGSLDNDPPVGAVTPSTQLCAAGGSVASATYHGVVCLSPIHPGGQVSTSSSYKLIPGLAHIVEAE